jgi:hypothetical protein
MLFNPSDFMAFLKNLVTGKNGTSATDPAFGSFDGGIKTDHIVPLSALTVGTLGALGVISTVTDNTGGTSTYGSGNTLGTVTTAFVNTQIANNFATLQAEITAIKNVVATLAVPNSESNAAALVVPAGTNQAIASFSFIVPREYDEASDQLGLLAFAALSSASDTCYLTCTPTFLPVGGTATTASVQVGTAEFGTATLYLTATNQRISFALAGHGVTRGTEVTLQLKQGGPGTSGSIYLYGVQPVWASTIVSYNETDGTGPDGTPFDTSGNQLR